MGHHQPTSTTFQLQNSLAHPYTLQQATTNKITRQQQKRRGKKEKTFAHARTTRPTISYWQTYFSVFYLCFQLGAGHINDNKLNLQAAKIQPRFVGVGLFKAEMWVLRCCLDQIEI